MNITVIGSGYVGLVSGTCFAEMGNKVTCVDIDPVKIEKLNNGMVPIFEPGLHNLVLNNVKNKNLFFTTELREALQDSEIAHVFQNIHTRSRQHVTLYAENIHTDIPLESDWTIYIFMIGVSSLDYLYIG